MSSGSKREQCDCSLLLVNGRSLTSDKVAVIKRDRVAQSLNVRFVSHSVQGAGRGSC